MDNKYNVFEINSILLNSEAQYDKQIPKEFNHNSFIYCVIVSVIKLLYKILHTLICAPFKYKIPQYYIFRENYEGKIYFRLPTLNNARSLRNVIEKVCEKKTNVRVNDEKDMEYNSHPLVMISIVSIWYLLDFWRHFKKLDSDSKRIVCYFISNFIYTPGLIWFYKKVLSEFRPEAIVLSNDHSFITKPLELICEDYNIPCIYVQHASVSDAFPELHFSHSFLDGKDSLQKYLSGSKISKGDIFVLGAARYDVLSNYRIARVNNKRNCIGIAINDMDDNSICNEVCNEIITVMPDVKIKIRLHPGMKNKPFSVDNKNVIVTCATDESMIEYLDSIDVQISNDSGVHLDAILGGVKTIAFNFSRYIFGDNYEYVKNGLIVKANDINQLVYYIETDSLIVDQNIVRQYDESYCKSYAGHCSDIIADFILSGYRINTIINKYKMDCLSYAGKDYYTITY